MNLEYSPIASTLWNSLNISIDSHGLAHLNQEWNQTHVRPPFSRLYYILTGNGIVTSGDDQIDLIPGKVYLLPYGQTVRYACPREMTQLYFHVLARTSDGYDLFSRCPRMMQLPLATDPEEMVQAYLSGDYLPLARLQNSIQADLIRFIDHAGLKNALLSPRSAFLERVFAAVRQELRSSLTIADIAKFLSLSESSLTKRFRQEFGMPLGRYMDEMLTQEISRLLAGTSLTIGQIADRLGFCDQFYLTRFFSAHQGMPPREYRAQLRG